MQIQLTTAIAGTPSYAPGDVADVDPGTGEAWIGAGYARLLKQGSQAENTKLSAHAAKTMREERMLRERRKAREDEQAALRRAFFHQWESRRLEIEFASPDHPHADRKDYDRAREALARDLARLDAHIGDIDAALSDLPRLAEAERRRIAQTTAVGPSITVPAVPANLLDGVDPKIHALIAEREQIIADRPQLLADRAAIEEEARSLTSAVERVALRMRNGLADASDVKTAEAASQAARNAVARVDAKRQELDQRVAAINHEISERQGTTEKARTKRIEAEIRKASRIAAKDLIVAMKSLTYYERLRRVSDLELPSFDALNADEPRGAGREFLQVLLDREIVTEADLK